MASPDLTLIADIDLRRGKDKLNKQLRAIERRGINIDTRRGVASLGRITGKADEFTQSLAASNARVIAFGASVAVIEGVRRSFAKLVSTIVEVESKLISINSILGRTTGGIKKFGDELFIIAKNTGKGFNEVADAAQEFARQGLSVEQTLKRTNDAMILTRLTTLSTEKAIGGLTAILNGFDKQALNSEQVINKLRAVETAFAVSSGDLTEALARSASVAQDAGVSFEELLGVITAIKQKTGLGGATIGQGLKTVFTRLNLPTRIKQLKDLGIELDENSSGLEKLRQVSIKVKEAQDAGNVSLATQIGAIAAGQFQISKLSAAFTDLSSAYSITDAAATAARNATSEATDANEAYNQSIQAMANAVNVNIGTILTKIGELGAQDAIKNAVSSINDLLNALQGDATGTGITKIIGEMIVFAKDLGALKGIAEGFINVLTGPALVTAAAVIVNLFKNTLIQGGASLLNLAGINKKTQERAALQLSINALLRQATAEELNHINVSKTQAQLETRLLALMHKQLSVQKSLELQGIRTAEAFRAQGLALTQVQGGFNFGRSFRPSAVISRARSGVSFAEGNIPSAVISEQEAINSGIGGASSNASPRVISRFNFGSGKVGPAVVNTDEFIIPNKASGDVVLTKDMMRNASSVKNFAHGNVNLSKREILAAEERVRKGQDLSNNQLHRIRRASLQKQGATIPTFLKNYVDKESPRRSAARITRFQQDERFDSQKSAESRSAAFERKVLNRKRISESQSRVPAGATFKGGSKGFVLGGGPQLNLPGPSPQQEAKERAKVAARAAASGETKRIEKIKVTNKRLTSIASREGIGSIGAVSQKDVKDLIKSFEKDGRSRKDAFKELRSRQFASLEKNGIEVSSASAVLQRRKEKRQRDSFLSTGNPVGEFGTKRAAVSAHVTSQIDALRKGGSLGKSDTEQSLRKTREGKKLLAELSREGKNIVNDQILPIRAVARKKVLDSAAATLDRESGFGGLRIGKGEKEALKTKGLGKEGRAKIRETAKNRRFARGQSLTQKGFLGSIALSAVAPIAGTAIGSRFGDKAGRGATGLLSGAATGLAAGSLLGPHGAIIGAVGGGIIGLITGLGDSLTELEKFNKEIEELEQGIRDTRNASSDFLRVQSQLIDLQNKGKGDSTGARLLEFDLNKILEKLPIELAKNLKESKGEGASIIVAEGRIKQEEELKTKTAQRTISELFPDKVVDPITPSFARSPNVRIVDPKSQETFIASEQKGLNEFLLRSADFSAAADGFSILSNLQESVRGDISSTVKEDPIGTLKRLFERFDVEKAVPEDITDPEAKGLLSGLTKFLSTEGAKKAFLAEGQIKDVSSGTGSFSLSPRRSDPVFEKQLNQVTKVGLFDTPEQKAELKAVQAITSDEDRKALVESMNALTEIQKEIKGELAKQKEAAAESSKEEFQDLVVTIDNLVEVLTSKEASKEQVASAIDIAFSYSLDVRAPTISDPSQNFIDFDVALQGLREDLDKKLDDLRREIYGRSNLPN